MGTIYGERNIYYIKFPISQYHLLQNTDTVKLRFSFIDPIQTFQNIL